MTTRNRETMTNDELYNACVNALAWGRLGDALAAADELCKPKRAKTCEDLLPLPRKCIGMDRYSDEQLQGLTDRIEQYNGYVLDR